jgi:2-dehydropantoate 2-reductase
MTASTDKPGKPSAVVVGAGAIGSVLAATLWRAGVGVEVLTEPVEAAELAAREGITVEGVGLGAGFTARPRVVSEAEGLSEGPDCVFLATKAIHVAAAARDVLPRLGPGSAVVVMQNGFCEEEVAGIVGPERVVSCTVRWGATLTGPTASRRTSRGGFTVGRLNGRLDPEDTGLGDAARLLRECAPVELTSNVLGVRCAKLVLNACLTTLGAASGLGLGDILARRAGRRAFIRVATEAVDVFTALGVRLEMMDGISVSWLCVRPERGHILRQRLRAELVLRLIASLRGGIVSSSLQSLRRGEPTEIDYLNGHVVRKAGEVGVEVPANASLVRIVKEIERGERGICPRNLALPV